MHAFELVWPARDYLSSYVDALERGWSPDNVRGLAATRDELARLAHDPAKTTLLDIYKALECRGVFSLHRQPPSPDCPVGVNIETVLGDVLQEVDSAVEQVLAQISINDVVQRLKPCGETTLNGKKHHKREQVSLSDIRAGARNRRAKAYRTA